MSTNKNSKNKPEITLTVSGPMIVRGPVEVIGPDGQPVALNINDLKMGVALCMCGRSKIMPFCDGSHAR